MRTLAIVLVSLVLSVTPAVAATNSMRIAREEIFGPVLTVIGYGTEDEAIAIANDTSYGLQ